MILIKATTHIDVDLRRDSGRGLVEYPYLILPGARALLGYVSTKEPIESLHLPSLAQRSFCRP